MVDIWEQNAQQYRQLDATLKFRNTWQNYSAFFHVAWSGWKEVILRFAPPFEGNSIGAVLRYSLCTLRVIYRVKRATQSRDHGIHHVHWVSH